MSQCLGSRHAHVLVATTVLPEPSGLQHVAKSEPFYAQVLGKTSVPAGDVASHSQHRQCLNLWLAQVLGEAIVPPESPAVQHLLMLAALAPQRLGFDPSEASTYRALPAALKVHILIHEVLLRLPRMRCRSVCFDSSEASTYRTLLVAAASNRKVRP